MLAHPRRRQGAQFYSGVEAKLNRDDRRGRPRVDGERVEWVFALLGSFRRGL